MLVADWLWLPARRWLRLALPLTEQKTSLRTEDSVLYHCVSCSTPYSAQNPTPHNNRIIRPVQSEGLNRHAGARLPP